MKGLLSLIRVVDLELGILSCLARVSALLNAATYCFVARYLRVLHTTRIDIIIIIIIIILEVIVPKKPGVMKKIARCLVYDITWH